jgi:hypothetical protein
LSHIPKRFEFQRVTSGVQNEKCALFARLAGKSNIGVEDELGRRRPEALGQLFPISPIQYESEVPDRDLFAIDTPGFGRTTLIRRQMGHDLVAKQVEIDPVLTRTPLWTTDQLSIKGASGGQIIDRESEMETGLAHGDFTSGTGLTDLT